MERLTARNERGFAYYPNCFREDGCAGNGGDCDICGFMGDVCNRLAELEDREEPLPVEYYYYANRENKMMIDSASCPACGKPIDHGPGWGCKFCPDCGQRLGWTEEDDYE